MVCARDVVHVVEHLHVRAKNTRKRHGTGAGTQPETGMDFVIGGFTRLTIRENNFELTWVDHGPGRERPLCEVHIIRRQIEARKGNDIRARVVDLDPGLTFAGGIRDAAHVLGLDFVNPKIRERRERNRGRIVGAGGQECRSILRLWPNVNECAQS